MIHTAFGKLNGLHDEVKIDFLILKIVTLNKNIK